MFKQNQNQQNAQNQMFLSYTKYVAYNKKIWLIVRTQKQMHLVLKVTISNVLHLPQSIDWWVGKSDQC